MGKLFGTDGARGIVGPELDALLALKIGSATARVLNSKSEHRLKFLVGSDTRVSKDVLMHALVAGVLSEDADVIDLGVIPTPAVSHLIQKYHADGGFVISASHNPSKYNGIKVFNEEGMKLPDDVEDEIEKVIFDEFELSKVENKVGTYKFRESAKEEYVDLLYSTLDEKIKGIMVGVDTANGAAFETFRLLLDKIGIEYMIMNDIPDGYNINDNAGSTHLEGLKEFVITNNLDCGIAFDGDADRCLMVDEDGNLVDGDKILAIYGKHLKEKKMLKGNAIVGTVMSNMGLSKFCERENLKFVATKVGDRYVLENMIENGYSIGGEQSGHIIFKDYANTGDGELTAIKILEIMCSGHKKLSELASIMETYPQVLKNVAVSREGKETYKDNLKVKECIEEVEKSLANEGRVLVRASGTENLIRVMLEGKDMEKITEYCDKIISVMESELK